MIFDKTNLDNLEFQPDNRSNSPSVWFLGRCLIWEKHLSKTIILLERGKERTEKILEFLTWIIIFAGYGAFFFWLWSHQETLLANPIKILFFWAEKDPLIFIFVITLWFNLFLYYKKTKTKTESRRINYKKFPASDKRNKKNDVYNINRSFSNNASRAVEDAFLLTRRLNQGTVTPLHLFRVLLHNKETQSLFIRLNVDIKRLVELIDNGLLKLGNNTNDGNDELHNDLKEVFIMSFIDAYESSQDSIDVLN
jgi:hypothetical protein